MRSRAYSGIITLVHLYLPQYTLAPVVLDDLVFYVDFMAVSLINSEQSPVSRRRTFMFDSIVASDVARINTWIIWRL